jgi:hypothetical protein
MSKENINEKEKLVVGPRWAPDTKTDWPTDCGSKFNFNFNFNFKSWNWNIQSYLYRRIPGKPQYSVWIQFVQQSRCAFEFRPGGGGGVENISLRSDR